MQLFTYDAYEENVKEWVGERMNEKEEKLEVNFLNFLLSIIIHFKNVTSVFGLCLQLFIKYK